MFAAALQHHQAGRLDDAERLYRQVLAADCRHSDSLNLLGVVAAQRGRHDLAVDMIGKAIAINATIPAYHCNLGAALKEHGRLDEAVACYRRALTLKPDYPEAHNNLGAALAELKRLDEAAACYRAALDLRPDFPGAHNSLGNLLRQTGRLEAAVACYRRALELRPGDPEAHNNLGRGLQQQGQLEAAVACYRRALVLRPRYPEALNNLANALAEQGWPDEAIACCRMALKLRPDDPEAHYNLGNALAGLGRLDEAVASCRRAVDLKPDFPEAHNNLGNALQQLRRLDEAGACYQRAVDLQPDFAGAHYNLAMTLLARGDMAAGWEEYEWRWQSPHMLKARRNFAQPQWRGEAAAGRTLLIHAEQGFGDTLQFCRYAPLAAARGLRVVMEVPKALVRLLQGLPGVDQVVGRGEPLPDFDLHCPMLSLPLALGPALATIPVGAYLQADALQVAAWRMRLGAMVLPGRRIGLAWAGNPALRADMPALPGPGPAGALVRPGRGALLQPAEGRPCGAREPEAHRPDGRDGGFRRYRCAGRQS